jgi:hypothetical protein
MPPIPTPAMLSFSLGGVWPAPPRTCRGTNVTAAMAAAAVPMKSRRESRTPCLSVLTFFIV